jgi:hypothetical protein
MSYPEMLGTLVVYFAAIFLLKFISRKFTPNEPPPIRARKQHISFAEFRQIRREKIAHSKAVGAYSEHRRTA